MTTKLPHVVLVETKRLMSRAQAEAAPHNDYVFHKVRRRNWLSVLNMDSGVWLTAGASPKIFEMSNDEFASAVCRRNTVEDPVVPKYKTRKLLNMDKLQIRII